MSKHTDYVRAMDVLGAIQEYVEKHGWPPSIRDITELVSHSKTSVEKGLTWLEHHYYIARGVNHEPRTIRIVKTVTKESL